MIVLYRGYEVATNMAKNYEVVTIVHYSRIVEAKNEGEAYDMGWEYDKGDVLCVYDIQVREIEEDEEE